MKILKKFTKKSKYNHYICTRTARGVELKRPTSKKERKKKKLKKASRPELLVRIAQQLLEFAKQICVSRKLLY